VERLGAGRYVVRGLLGEGAQGTTYEATRAADGRAVAVKRFDVRGARSWKDVELAERETRVLASLDHPLVARYVEHFEEDGALYLVMERLEGETLEAMRAREGALSEAEVRRFLADADRALTYLHGRASPIVHRDLKPRNVVRRPDGSYVLVDFGAVSELVRRRAGASTVVGTLGYMAPEQFQGRAMPASDVYAVGATALALLAGADPETLPHRGLRVDVRAALAGRGVSPSMVGCLERMLEPDPELRPSSIGGVLDTLRSEAPPPLLAPVPGPGVPSGRAAKAKEDARVKSLRGLLWVLWGLGWILVPIVLGQIGAGRFVPVVMFGSLAALIVLSWHKGAALRAMMRAVLGAPAHEEPSVRRRVEVHPDPKVRIQTGDLAAGEELGRTEVASPEASAPPRKRAR
jgi:serine/threonine protein kinase